MKYSIVMNYLNGGYSLVINSFEINEEGERVYVDNKIYTNKTLAECITIINSI
jgi:hypothetical protein